MKFSLGVAALSLASTVAAAPAATCFTEASAQELVARFTGVITHQGSDLGDAETTAYALFAEGYEEVSDSVLSLMQNPEAPVSLRCRFELKRDDNH